MEAISLLAFFAAIWKAVDLVRYATAKDTRAVITQCIAYAAGIAGVFLVGASDFAESWDVGADVTLSDMNGASKAIVGIVFASASSAIVDFKRARDNSDSAAVPVLGGDPNPQP